MKGEINQTSDVTATAYNIIMTNLRFCLKVVSIAYNTLSSPTLRIFLTPIEVEGTIDYFHISLVRFFQQSFFSYK